MSFRKHEKQEYNILRLYIAFSKSAWCEKCILLSVEPFKSYMKWHICKPHTYAQQTVKEYIFPKSFCDEDPLCLHVIIAF